MDIKQIAETLCEGCRNNTAHENLDMLYAADAQSVEATPSPETGEQTAVGIEAIRKKHQWWDDSFETHSVNVRGPHFHGEDRFAVIFEMDATEKQSQQRFQMEEVGIYSVAGGKIVKEEFFYQPMS